MVVGKVLKNNNTWLKYWKVACFIGQCRKKLGYMGEWEQRKNLRNYLVRIKEKYSWEVGREIDPIFE